MQSEECLEPAAAGRLAVVPGSAEDRPAARMVPWTASTRDAEGVVGEEDQEGARWIQQEWKDWRQWSESTDAGLLPGLLKTRLLAALLDAGRLVHRGPARAGVVTFTTALVFDDATLAAQAGLLARIEQFGRNLLHDVAARLAAIAGGWAGADSRAERGKKLRDLVARQGRRRR